ncbi:hypothetical protein CRG98_017212 [Punica granatum]|uniref:Uncharacterized protein n=2 Tax=Punica granatum TaxID=22663 RepID=A0A2I0K3W9_PUNGR|nr:hypothetical protein CRG98_017212 [Punica granatum]
MPLRFKELYLSRASVEGSHVSNGLRSSEEERAAAQQLQEIELSSGMGTATAARRGRQQQHWLKGTEDRKEWKELVAITGEGEGGELMVDEGKEKDGAGNEDGRRRGRGGKGRKLEVTVMVGCRWAGVGVGGREGTEKREKVRPREGRRRQWMRMVIDVEGRVMVEADDGDEDGDDGDENEEDAVVCYFYFQPRDSRRNRGERETEREREKKGPVDEEDHERVVYLCLSVLREDEEKAEEEDGAGDGTAGEGGEE